jgi:hypothetical protein
VVNGAGELAVPPGKCDNAVHYQKRDQRDSPVANDVDAAVTVRPMIEPMATATVKSNA